METVASSVLAETLEYRGCGLSYRVAGAGPPVVLIQGVAVHGNGWAPQVEVLGSRYRCLSFDNRGMGASQPPGGELSVEGMAEDVVALMDRLAWDSAHVVGHSLGGVIAQQLALAYPRRVRSLSLICTVSRGSDATKLTLRMLLLGLRSTIGTRRMRRRAFLRIVMPPSGLAGADLDELAEALEPIFGHDIADRPPITLKQLAALRAYDATPRLVELGQIPTLVVSAEHDPIAPPRYGRPLAASIRGARYVEIADASHGVTVHRAGEVNDLLMEHIAAAENAYSQPS